MNDTHGVAGEGWHGFDLDGTLAVYDKWEGIDHIGEPVKPMVDLIKRMHAEGKVVKILTARVSPRPEPEVKPNPYLTDLDVYRAVGKENEEKYHEVYRNPNWTARDFISDWCLKNLGFLPEITHEKDHLMISLYDDRVKQVVPNEGVLIEDEYRRAIVKLNKADELLAEGVGPRIEIRREKISAADFAFMMVGRIVVFLVTLFAGMFALAFVVGKVVK